MEDPGTLLYVAFVVISLIVGYFRNRKKKLEEAQEFEKASDMTDMSESLSKHEIEHRIREQKRAQIEALERLDEINRASQAARIQKSESNRKSLDIIELEEVGLDETEETENIIEEFDARKAIIYSEIMNPPYL